MRSLTPTSYAILGLLTLQPWSAYELTRQMERSLRFFWPRAESKLYEEPKTLVAHGYATAERQREKRRRTVYTITAEGQAAFRRWLDAPAATPTLEFEGLIKVFFAEQGTRQQLLASLHVIAAQAEAAMGHGEDLGRQYLAHEGPFPDRTHVNALVYRFLGAHNEMLAAWARWAIMEVEQWPVVAPHPDLIARGLAIMDETVADLSARHSVGAEQDGGRTG